MLCLEWLDPYYVGGHWVPEMIRRPAAKMCWGARVQPSFRVSSEEIAESRADVIMVMPCGYNTERAYAEASATKWPRSGAICRRSVSGRIFAADANSYFSRPGPRLADGVNILAQILHPELFPVELPSEAFRRLA